MRIFYVFAILVAGLVVESAHAQSPNATPRGRLLFLGIAYDEAPGPGLTVDNFNYAPDNFATLFNAQSKELFTEIKVETIKGNAATRDGVAARLAALQKVAKKNDLVFLYWGTHGGTDAKGWGANLPGDAVVYGSEIKAELARVPCPVIVAISTCGSGGFVRPKPQQVELPDNVAAFCACRRKQETSNELDVSLLEALAGFGDSDHNGEVTLREALDYVPRRYRELFRDEEGADTVPVLGHAEKFALDRPLTRVKDTHVAAVHDGTWYGATIVQRLSGKAKVRFLGWDSTSPRGGFAFPDEVVPDDHLDFPGGNPPIEVESVGAWYAAVIVAKRPKGFKIHYVGYPDSDDEVVPPKRIRYLFTADAEAAR